MAVNTNIQVPFLPQQSITEQVLSAIQLANEAHYHQQQLALQGQQQQTAQGQLELARQKTPAEIQEALARAGYYGAETQRTQFETDQKRATIAMFGGQAPEAGRVCRG